MSGFSSLLDQFKQTTRRASAGADAGRKRPRPDDGGGAPAQHLGATRRPSPNSQDSRRRQRQQSERYRHPAVPVRTVYVACPAFVETGGPEALHQLCHAINVGGYRCGDDSNSNATNNGNREAGDAMSAAGYDEFGRAIASNINSGSSKGGEAMGKRGGRGGGANVLRAYMLYLRERGAELEHVASPRARCPKYDRYVAPPAPAPLFLGGTADEYSHDHDCDNDRGGNGNGIEGQGEGEGVHSPDLVVWPECWTHLIDSLNDANPSARGGRKHQIAIWWLSVNNNKGRFLPHQFVSRKDVLHLVQSAYARKYVSSRLGGGDRNGDGGKGVGGKGGTKEGDGEKGEGPNVLTMTEFIPHASPAFSSTHQNDNAIRDLDVVYNPAKGQHYTDEIIRRVCGKKAKANFDGSVSGGGIRFSPIGKGPGGRERMSEGEVIALLRRSKVYIDFGPHPGMDRLPREAALAGCVVLTNREGAADFDDDVPLPSEFKFGKFDVDAISSLLKDCCNNHAEYVAKMDSYKTWMMGQQKRMEACVDRLVDRVVTRRIVAGRLK